MHVIAGSAATRVACCVIAESDGDEGRLSCHCEERSDVGRLSCHCEERSDAAIYFSN